MRKKILGLFVLIVFVSLLFGLNSVNAVSSTFTLKDGFEDYINNRIYTEYDNYTLEEYFQDYKGDQAHFTEDKEGFAQTGGAIDNGISNSYFELIALGDNDGYYTPQLNLTEYPVMECRIWVNVTTTRFINTFYDYLGNYFGNTGYETLTANEWTTFSNVIDASKLDDIRRMRLNFHPEHDDYPVLIRLDYVKFWKGNYTDYAFQSGDSWDFGEGDYDNWVIYDNPYYRSITSDEEDQCVQDEDRIFMKQRIALDLNSEYYNQFKVRIYSNRTNPQIQVLSYDNTKLFLTTSFASNEWVILTIDLSLNEFWDDTIGLMFRFATTYAWEMYKVDYTLLYHDDLEDEHTQIQQETSYYRASKGFRSYYKGIPLNFTYYEGYTANFNSSIIIDVPSLEFFPETCYFNYYSNVPFNFSLFIDTTEYLLFENTEYLNDWRPLRETVNREDFLFNTTTHEIYFELYTFKNETEYIYIDELEVKYTNPSFTVNFEYGHTISGTTDFDFNVSGSSIKFDGSHGNGLWDIFTYNTSTNNVITRRAYFEYVINTDEDNFIYNLTHRTFIEIDEILEVRVQFMKIGDNATYMELRRITEVFDGEMNCLFRDRIDWFDYILIENFEKYKLTINIEQVDFKTISFQIGSINLWTGNNTFVTSNAFDIPFTSYNNTMITMYHESIFDVNVIALPPQPLGAELMELKISRSIQHSSVEKPSDSEVLPFWRWDSEFSWKSNLRTFFTFMRATLVNFFKRLLEITTFLGDFKTLFGDILEGIKTTFQELITVNINLGSIIGIIQSILSQITSGFTSIISSLSNIVTTITNIFNLMDSPFLDFITNFFDNIATPFGDMWDTGQGGFSFLSGWGDISDNFQSGDWGDVSTSWGNFFPSLTTNLIDNTVSFWGGFADTIFGIPLDDIFTTIVTFWGNFTAWLTLLIIIYLIWMAQLLVRGDWDRMRKEITSIVNLINWIVSGIVKLIHWIFEIIWALLDVLIPFT